MFSRFIEQLEIDATCAACGCMSMEVYCEKKCPSCGLGPIEAVEFFEKNSEHDFIMSSQ